MKNVQTSWLAVGVASLAIGVAGLATILGGGTDSVMAQAYGTPSGVRVGGATVDASHDASVGDTQPRIQGNATPGTQVTIRITPGDIIVTTTAGADGAFSVQVPAVLKLGTYSIFVNDAAVGTFSVVKAPNPPATGSGIAGDGGSRTQIALFSLAGLLAVVAASSRLLRRR